MKPAVGPKRIEKPALPPANTGSPIAPSSIYKPILRTASRGLKSVAQSPTPNVCKEKGTAPIGITICDKTAINAAPKAGNMSDKVEWRGIKNSNSILVNLF